MNLRFYPRHFALDPRQKPTLFFTLPRAYELSLAFQHFIFMIPLQPFSAVLRIDLAGNLDPCHLTRYPKLMTYPGRKRFLFWQCVLDFVVVWYFVLPGEIYFPASWCLYDVTSVVHWARSEKSIWEPAPRPPASDSFSSLSWYIFFLLDLDSLSQAPR